MIAQGRAAYEALLDDLLRIHIARVNTVHAGAHHDVRRNLFSGCSCGWAGSHRVSDDYDTEVPMPCPTVEKIKAFRALNR